MHVKPCSLQIALFPARKGCLSAGKGSRSRTDTIRPMCAGASRRIIRSCSTTTSSTASHMPVPTTPSDTGAVPTRVMSSRFIGRTRELAELEAAIRDASDGRPSLAFIAGESGVGKTRLLNELERRALTIDVRVLTGDCVALGEDELPYAPIVAALRSLTRDGDPVLDELGPATRAGLASLLPELAPATRSAGGAAAVPGSDGEAPPQARVFEALLSLL